MNIPDQPTPQPGKSIWVQSPTTYYLRTVQLLDRQTISTYPDWDWENGEEYPWKQDYPWSRIETLTLIPERPWWLPVTLESPISSASLRLGLFSVM